MNFSKMVTDSVLARALALFILALVAICAIIIATVDFINGRPVPDLITNIVVSSLTAAGALAGINYGLLLQPTPGPTTQNTTTGGNNVNSTNP